MTRDPSNVVALHQGTFSGKSNPPPRKPRNADVRSREYLRPDEVERLRKAAGQLGRYRHRDATLVLVMYRHALRVSEAVSLRWDQIDFDNALVHVRRAKGGLDSVHPLTGTELRALRKLRRDTRGVYVFETERGGPLTTSTVRKLIARAAFEAELGLAVHPHMLRHACGYKLANDGVDTRALQQFMGHKSITHTVRYTELRADRFNGFWKD